MDAGSAVPDEGGPLPWVRAALGNDVRSATRARWGFRHETWVVEVAGERLVVQRRADGSDPTLPPWPAIRRLVREAGLATPEPVRLASPGPDVVLVLPAIDGTVAAELLRAGHGAELVGRACGWVASRLRSIDPAAIALPGPPGGFGETTPVVAHGDLAPVNILIRGERVVGVLDLDRIRLAHRDYDAAWFAWVVTTHHPALAHDAWRGFADAAGLGDRTPSEVAWLWPIQLAERVREAASEPERARWLGHLEAAPEV